MAMTEEQQAEFTAFLRKEGLSGCGTYSRLWEEARPLGLLAAIYAVMKGEVPSGQRLEDLRYLEPYAAPLLEPQYFTTAEAAEQLAVSTARVRDLMATGRLAYKDTPLGRLLTREAIEQYDEERNNATLGRPRSKPVEA